MLSVLDIELALTCPRGFSFMISSDLFSLLEKLTSLLGIPSHMPFSASTSITFQHGGEPEPHHKNMFSVDIVCCELVLNRFNCYWV